MLNTFPATLYPVAGPHRFGALGFTLIEMMIVVVIIAIATMLGIPSYRAWIQNTQIYNAAESAQNGLQKAKALAVSMNANVEFVLGTTPYPVWKIQTPGNTLTCPLPSGTALTTLLECATAEGTKNVSISAVLNDNTIQNTISNIPAQATTITFNNLGGVGTNVNGTVFLKQINFTSANSTISGLHKLQVNIGVGGNSRMCDPDPTIPATNPRKC